MGFADFGGPGQPIAGFYGADADLLGDFYLPLLERARRYDRASGYFTSWGIAVAAQGLARFLPGGGAVRLVVGAQLDSEDVAAIETPADLDEALVDQLSGNGSLDPDLGDLIAQRRREILAWLVAEGRCHIKVGLRRGSDGKPIPALDDPNYFHHKLGVFDDGGGRLIAFSGSGNETWSGWVGNSESFSVVASWWGDAWWAAQGAEVVDQIERMWQGDAGGGWMTVDLPEAVRDKLVKYAPGKMPPPREPAEKPEKPKVLPVVKTDPTVVEGRLADVIDRLRTQVGSGIRTAGVEPMPHQVSILHRAIDRWPRGHLYADEVGLGKTIEVGLTVREAVVRGLAARVLLLVPAAVIGQWQEELAEKLALWVPSWDGPTVGWRWPDYTTTDPSDGDPWIASHPVTLISSHLARMRRNREQLLASGPWDIVAVDEAHHARRRGGKPDGEPNLLLSLLHDMFARESWRTLLLATATPM
ncbi:MAG: helicase, partial [Actinobacteria bacterium]|nr:helicase [Actinomycetota bacterium]